MGSLHVIIDATISNDDFDSNTIASIHIPLLLAPPDDIVCNIPAVIDATSRLTDPISYCATSNFLLLNSDNSQSSDSSGDNNKKRPENLHNNSISSFDRDRLFRIRDYGVLDNSHKSTSGSSSSVSTCGTPARLPVASGSPYVPSNLTDLLQFIDRECHSLFPPWSPSILFSLTKDGSSFIKKI